jgi:hypothetical protein
MTYPAASPSTEVIVVTPRTDLAVPMTPLMCPGINPTDPRPC